MTRELKLKHPLRRWRAEHGLTVGQAAKKVGRSHSAWTTWEAGAIPNDRSLFQLAKLMGTTPDKLLSELQQWKSHLSA